MIGRLILCGALPSIQELEHQCCFSDLTRPDDHLKEAGHAMEPVPENLKVALTNVWLHG